MKKTLGLDLGITSVGWGIVDENRNIIDYGVRLFDEQQVDNNATRRELRGHRRIIRRRKQRIYDLRYLLEKNGIIDNNFEPLPNPYLIRKKGLSEKLTNDELATALLNLVKRRGSSLETVEEVSSNEDSTKTILSRNEALLNEEKYIVNVQLSKLATKGKLRGTDNVYKTSDYLIEVNKILSNQDIDESLKNKIINIVERRRHFSEGPGSLISPSKYGRFRDVDNKTKQLIINNFTKEEESKYLNDNFDVDYEGEIYTVFKNGLIVNKNPYDLIALMRGRCSVYPDEFRAPKNSFSAELFNLLNDLNNLKILDRLNNKITVEEKNKVIDIIREKGNITINQLLKLLNTELVNVKGFRVNNNDVPQLTEFKGYKKILKICKDNNYEILSDNNIDEVMEILTETVIEEERFNKIIKIVNDEKLATLLSNLTGINEYHRLSFKALRELNKEMIVEPKNQQEILTEKNLKSVEKLNKLVADESAILSPTAKRTHREALKVVNELIRIHGNFDKIIIETTRDKNSADQRKNIRDLNKYLEDSRKEAEEVLVGYGEENVNRSNILKLRLYKEQNGKCAYSGKPLDLSLLVRDSRAYEVDHIIPISISYDDSYNNKVLVLPTENQRKGNKTPFGYFMSGLVAKDNPINNWDKFNEYVTSNNNYSRVKKQNLLFMRDIYKYEVLKEFINRNIVDTSYAIRSLMTTLKDYFNYNNIETQVLTIRGKQTDLFRKIGISLWNRENPNMYEENPLIKNRDEYKHHAIDALIIAGLANQKTMRKLYNIVIEEEGDIYDERTGEISSLQHPSDETGTNIFLKQLSKLEFNSSNFSWKIDTKPNRKISDQTIYSTRIVDGNHRIIKKISNIYELETKKLHEFLYGKNKDSLLMSKHDDKTFEILKKAYDQYSHEKYPLKVFKDNHGPIRKYSKKNNGPIINQLKYVENRLGNHIDVTPIESTNKKVVLLQISPYRADVYYSSKAQKYRIVTIRYNDVKKNNNGYYIDQDWYDKQKEKKKIKDEYEFKFTLNKNNLVELKNSKETKFYRYVTVSDDPSNKIEFKEITKHTVGRIRPTITNQYEKITKYNVSPTGIISKVIKEDLKLNF